MNVVRQAGSSKDQETWSKILEASNDYVSHHLWVSLVIAVAELVIEKKTGLSKYTEDFETNVAELIEAWLDETIPAYDDLAWILGELDYFRDIDLTWEEKISLSGPACGYSEDVVWDLRNKLECYPNAQEAITEDKVQTFFTCWRSDFLGKVLEAARSIR